MNQKTYFVITALIFLIVAILHLLRIFTGWEVSINGWMIPLWVSWVAFVGSSFLAYSGFNQNRRSPEGLGDSS